ALCLWASIIWQRVQIARGRSEFYLQQAAEIARIEESYSDLAREFAGLPPVTKTRPMTIVDALLPDGTFIRLTPYSHHGPCGGVHLASGFLVRILFDGTVLRSRFAIEIPCAYGVPEGYRQADEGALGRLVATCKREAARLGALR